jgi:hypothetical protein
MLPPADPAAPAQAEWVAALQKLLADDVLRQQLAEKAHQRAIDFSHSRTFQRWRQLIDQTLAAPTA